MPKLTMTKGLPGSGKSTWSRAQVAASSGQTKRVNMDDLREMLHNSEFNKRNETFMQSVREKIIRECLFEGYNVIADDTNLHPKHEALLRAVAADLKATFAVQDFTDVPVEECIRRDLLRSRSVGEQVIRSHWKKYLFEPAPTPAAPARVDGPRAIIVDIDGTVARMVSRGPHEYHRVSEDEPRHDVIQVVRDWVMMRLQETGIASFKVIFCSGRPETCRADTEDWLQKHVIKPLGLTRYEWDLFMRPEFLVDPKSQSKKRDFRKDSIVKSEIYNREILGKYNVDFVLDDRDQVVQAWRERGLLVLQCAPGDF